MFLRTVSPWIQPTSDEKYFGKEKFGKVSKSKTWTCLAGNYLYSIYIVLGTISNLETSIWKMCVRAQWLSCIQVFCNLMDCNPPGSSVHGISQAKILEGVATPSSRGSSQPRDRTQVSHIAAGFFTVWPTREAPDWVLLLLLLIRFSRVRLCATP